MHLFFVLSIFLYGQSSRAAFKVFIDPGHGGNEPGARYEGVTESELALKISKELLTLIQENPSMEAQLSRTSNQALSLEERSKKAESFNTDLFVSIHANSSPNAKACGTEFYFQNTLPSTEESLYLANLEEQILKKKSEQKTQSEIENLSTENEVDAILEDLKIQSSMHRSLLFSKNLKKNWHPKATIKQGAFFVISKQPYPSVLVELGYLTNPKDRQLLKQSYYQKDLAQKIYDSIHDYQQIVDKKDTKALN